MPTIEMPNVPVLGVPEGEKQAGQRVDFKPKKFDLLIETKGYLLAWERATVCPCAPVSPQTEQPDPNCPLCGGSGWFYFTSEQSNVSEYVLDEVQTELASGKMLIRGVITSIANMPNPLDKMGNWVAGTMNLTVRPENKLGYWDRIVALDSQIVFSEILDADGTDVTETRYLVTGMNMLRSSTTLYKLGTDFALDKGKISWYAGKAPGSGERLAIHYLCHPTWLVTEHPHAARTTSVLFKTPSPKTPTGDPRDLPVQALVKYEFLND